MHKTLTRLWSLATRLPLPALALILAAQTLFALKSRDLWFSDEVRYANVFEHLMQAKKWLVMYLNGVPYPDKPPVYFWFLACLKPLYPSSEPALFFLGAALSAFILVVCTVVLARKVFQADRDTTLGAGLILLTCFYFIGLCHYSRMDLLFASFITLSQIFLYFAWQKDKAPCLLIAGFVLAGLAVLTKGPLGLAFPIVTSLVYLAWTGRIKRFFRKDVGLAAGVCLVILLAWVAGAYLSGEYEYLQNIFHKQIYKRAVNAPHHLQPFYHYALTLPLAWMPWTLILFALPMRNLLLPDFWRRVWTTRKSTDQGAAYLWIMVIGAFSLLSVVSIKIIVYLLPLFPPLAILTAHALANLSERAARRLFLMIGILFLVLGANAPFANFMHPWPIKIKGLLMLAAASLALGYLLIKYARRLIPLHALLFLALGITAWLQPLSLITAPSLDPAMSPKAQATIMGEYVGEGYVPVAYKIYSGIYNYYAHIDPKGKEGEQVIETQDMEKIETILRDNPRVVLAMRRKYWDGWENRPENVKIVHEQWIVNRPFVLAVKEEDGRGGL